MVKLTEAAKARRDQKKQEAREGHDFYRGLDAMTPRKPKVHTLSKLRRKRS